MANSWRVTLPCSKADGDRLKDDIGPLALLDTPPVLMTREVDEAYPDIWQLAAYFEGEPDADLVDQLKALLSDPNVDALVEEVKDEDWVTLSQAGLEPITEGRFHVHTSAYPDSAPEGSIVFQIEAGLAFGTGQHQTTSGCLAMLDQLATEGHHFRNILDLGTGTGVLAFAALRTFNGRTIASDIDPISIEVSTENAELNGISVGRNLGQVELVVADGLDHRRLQQRAPYDLIIANILAGPLIELAPSITDALAPGGIVILAGLLDHQADGVSKAYLNQGCRLAARIDRDEWPTLCMRKSRSA